LFKRTDGGPWIASWHDYAGRRRQRSTRTVDHSAAERILSKLVSREALRREGVIDARQDACAAANRLPLADHVAAYLEHCRRTGQAAKHIAEKHRHLGNILTTTGASRLSELTADALEHHLWAMTQGGLSARTANFARQAAVAFMSWCVKTGRCEGNPLEVVAKLDERNDRRRVRRALSDDELARLLAVAEPRGRKAWYMAAALAGLRRGDLAALTWADVDLTANTITIRNGKAKREDVIPLHPQLADELRRRHEQAPALPGTKVFSGTVTALTVQKDLLRAGIARREAVTDAQGKPVIIGKGKRQRPKTRITTEDARRPGS
jgi:integrase